MGGISIKSSGRFLLVALKTAMTVPAVFAHVSTSQRKKQALASVCVITRLLVVVSTDMNNLSDVVW